MNSWILKLKARVTTN